MGEDRRHRRDRVLSVLGGRGETCADWWQVPYLSLAHHRMLERQYALRALPQISSPETQLGEAGAPRKQKYGGDVDEEDRCDADGMLWVVVVGNGAMKSCTGQASGAKPAPAGGKFRTINRAHHEVLWRQYPLQTLPRVDVQIQDGLYDPLGLTVDGAGEGFRCHRESEMEHGRGSMLASLRVAAPGRFLLPSYPSPLGRIRARCFRLPPASGVVTPGPASDLKAWRPREDQFDGGDDGDGDDHDDEDDEEDDEHDHDGEAPRLRTARLRTARSCWWPSLYPLGGRL